MQTESIESKKYQKRHQARLIAAQAIYSWIIAHTPIQDAKVVLAELDGLDHPQYDVEFFDHITSGVLAHHESLDALINPYFKQGVVSLRPIERAIIWISLFELSQEPLLLAPSIILNEAIELVKLLSEPNAHKFINAALDNFIKDSGIKEGKIMQTVKEESFIES